MCTYPLRLWLQLSTLFRKSRKKLHQHDIDIIRTFIVYHTSLYSLRAHHLQRATKLCATLPPVNTPFPLIKALCVETSGLFSETSLPPSLLYTLLLWRVHQPKGAEVKSSYKWCICYEHRTYDWHGSEQQRTAPKERRHPYVRSSGRWTL